MSGPLGLPADSQRCGAAVIGVARDGADVILTVEPERGGATRLRLAPDQAKALAARLAG